MKKAVLKQIRNIQSKAPVLESLFNNDTTFLCEYCEIFKNTCFYRWLLLFLFSFLILM